MTIYEIDEQIIGCINTETGEFDEEKYNELQLTREAKVENICLWYKELGATAKAISEEIDSLTERKKSLERSQDRLSYLIEYALQGEKFETGKVKCSWRKSTSVEITDEWAIPEAYKVEKITKTISKAAIKEAIKNGEAVPGAELVEKNKVQVK